MPGLSQGFLLSLSEASNSQHTNKHKSMATKCPVRSGLTISAGHWASATGIYGKNIRNKGSPHVLFPFPEISDYQTHEMSSVDLCFNNKPSHSQNYICFGLLLYLPVPIFIIYSCILWKGIPFVCFDSSTFNLQKKENKRRRFLWKEHKGTTFILDVFILPGAYKNRSWPKGQGTIYSGWEQPVLEMINHLQFSKLP